MIFAGPGIAAGGRCAPAGRAARPLSDARRALRPRRRTGTGRPQPRPAVEGPRRASRPWPAITTHNQGNHAVRTEHWRYIRYADGSEELYDHRTDPNEWTNLAGDPKHAEIKRELAGWLPKRNEPPAPGSLSRLLTKVNGVWTWEHKPIVPSEKNP